MPRKNKKFVNKNAPGTVTFHLVHRSQFDPLIADEGTSERVLVGVPQGNAGIENALPYVEYPDSDDEGGAAAAAANSDSAAGGMSELERKEQLTQYGIYFDDDYDYNQHLKERGQPGSHLVPADEDFMRKLLKGKEEKRSVTVDGVEYPAEVFASAYESEIGLLSRAAPVSGPQLDWDPEIIEALDDALDLENPDNKLDDDYMGMVLGLEDDGEGGDAGAYLEGEEQLFSSDGEADDDERSDLFDRMAGWGGVQRGGENTGGEETRSRFTEYSMSSSVLPRTDAQQRQDSHFEKFYEQYDEEQTGALDDDMASDDEEAIDKHLESLILSQPLPRRKDADQKFIVGMNEMILSPEDLRVSTAQSLRVLEVDESEIENENSMDKDADIVPFQARKTEWDCETVASMRSTLYNHPLVISEPSKRIQIDSKTGLPVAAFQTNNAENSRGEKEESGEESEGDDDESAAAARAPGVMIRPKGETAEEKKLRKLAVKEAKRERRVTKKTTKDAFRKELSRQQGSSRQSSVRTVRID